MRLRSSKLGDDFPRERFLRTPIRTIMEALSFIDSEEQRHYNLACSSTAKLCMQVIAVAHGFSGTKTPLKLKIDDYLPFPDWKPPEDGTGSSGPSPATKAVLTKLVQERRLPLAIYSQLLSSDEPL